jgi:hypothetical protein
LNSWPESASAADFIWTSLGALRRECPPAYRLMCEQMAGRDLLVEIDGGAVGLRFHTGQVEPLAWDEQKPPALRLRTSWRTILDLADARQTLVEAAMQGSLDLRGPPAELAVLYEGMLTYLRGAVRCPSFPGLLEAARGLI